jgi:hypothetical protein
VTLLLYYEGSKNPFIEGPYSMVKNDKYSLAKLT